MNKIISALRKFGEEHTIFLSARIYLYNIEVSSEKGNREIKEAHDTFSERLGSDYESPHDYIISRMFISYISAFELFLQEIIIDIIRKHPKKVGSISFKISEILDASGKDELIQRAAEEHINKIMYKKPSEYLHELANILSIETGPIEVLWNHFIEAKARRDLGVHNGWICNETYIRKLDEAKITPDISIGELALPIKEDYLDKTPNLIFDLSREITNLGKV